MTFTEGAKDGKPSDEGTGGYGVPMVQCNIDHRHRSANKVRECPILFREGYKPKGLLS